VQEQVTTSIGTELLFENDRIRVWDMVLQPGQESPLHRHEGDYVFIYTTPSRLTAFLENQPPTTSDFDDGFVQYTEVGPGTVHKIRNAGAREHRQILVEFKGPSVAPSLQQPENNGRTRPATD
jgi:predicted metal-dependent enzyme (double-stranded beta helix superfamily)